MTDSGKALPQLLAQLCDGTLPPDEARQLNQLLLDDPLAIEAYLDHLELDAMLEREFAGPAVAEVVSIPSEVSRAPSEVSRLRLHARGLAMIAVLMLLTTGVFWSRWTAVNEPSTSAPPKPPGLLVARATGNFEVLSPDGRVAAVAIGRPVQGRETVRTHDGHVALQYDDGTEIDVTSSSELSVGDEPELGKRLRLSRGKLTARVVEQPAGRPMEIATPQAVVRVLGTEFELNVVESTGTRLELTSGRVELRRDDAAGSAEQPVIVEPDSVAVVPVDGQLISISPRPQRIAAPARKAHFPGVQFFDFLADGTAVAASGRGVVYWSADDEFETVRPLGDAECSIVRQSGAMLAIEVKSPRKLVVWDAVRRQVVHEVDAERLPAIFGVRSADASGKEPAYPSLKLAELSPNGDWIAGHVRRDGVDDVVLFDLASGVERLRQWQQPLMSFMASPDGRLLAIGQTAHAASQDQPGAVVELLDTATDHVAAVARPRPPSGDGSYLTGETRSVLPLLKKSEKKQPGIVPSKLAFSADGRRLAVAVNGWLQVWDVAESRQVAMLADAADVQRIALSSTGEIIAASSKDAVRVWDVEGFQKIAVLEPAGDFRSLRFAPERSDVAAVARPRPPSGDGSYVDRSLAALLAGGQMWVWNWQQE